MSLWLQIAKTPLPPGVSVSIVVQCECCGAQFQMVGRFDPDRGLRLESEESNILKSDGGTYVATHWKKLSAFPKPVHLPREHVKP